MFRLFRQSCERLLRIPGDPEPPPGDEASTLRFRAAPNYYRYLLCVWALRTFGILFILIPMEIGPILAGLQTDEPITRSFIIGLPQIVVGIIFLFRLFSLALVRLDFEKRWYLVTDRSLRLREGILHVREMTITFANIQNISISQGPLQRLLGIADLRVDTAGGSAPARRERKGMPQSLHTAFFRGVDNANAIREIIQTRLRALKDSGLGDHEELAAGTMRTPSPGFSQEFVAALREVAAEATALRSSL